MPKNESEVVKMAAKNNLLPKEEKFCLMFRKYLGNGKKAAIAAGYAENSASVTASKLLKKANVLKRINELAKDAERKTIMDTMERQERLTKIARDDTAENRDRVRAIDILNKMDGKYLIKVDVTVTARFGDELTKRRKRWQNG